MTSCTPESRQRAGPQGGDPTGGGPPGADHRGRTPGGGPPGADPRGRTIGGGPPGADHRGQTPGGGPPGADPRGRTPGGGPPETHRDAPGALAVGFVVAGEVLTAYEAGVGHQVTAALEDRPGDGRSRGQRTTDTVSTPRVERR